MAQKTDLKRGMETKEFRECYFLKEELVEYCRQNGLPVSGSKEELTERVSWFLETGGILQPKTKRNSKASIAQELTVDSSIEADFVCSEVHRRFFKEKIGPSFTFNVAFQKWLKTNPGRTYADAIEAYHAIRASKKASKTKIDPQFEYNAYIRDFFAANKGLPLQEAIKCWKYKKSRRGHHRYESSDLIALAD